MTIQEVKRKIRRAIEECLHNNKQSIIFNTNIKKVYTTEYEVMILDLTKEQEEVLKNKLEYYARVQQKSSNTWYFFLEEK